MQVKIVLRDRETGLYHRGNNQWARNGYDALTFANILEAEAYCRAHGLRELQCIQQCGYFFRSRSVSGAGSTAQISHADVEYAVRARG